MLYLCNMKKRKYITYCYFYSRGGYYRQRHIAHSLTSEFPLVALVFENCGVFKIHFYHHGNEALAWRDRYNNIMVRVFLVDTQLPDNYV